MDDRRVADYFVVAGLPEKPEPLDEFSRDANLKPTYNQAPITDITVIFPSLGELPPHGFSILETTPSGFPADLNHGSLRSPSVYICYKRGRDRPPLVDIGVLYEGKERVMADSEVVQSTPYGKPANVNNSGSRTFLTYRKATDNAPCNELVVTDVCVILANKGEIVPHAFCFIDKNLNKGMVGSAVYLCYKKSMNRPNSVLYKPGILGRFPLSDYPTFPLPESVPLFCLPMGSSIECWPDEASSPIPVSSTFVLTVSDAVEKVYGTAVTFYESHSAEKLTSEQKTQLSLNGKVPKRIHVNKCICILSHWPFFDTFDSFLLHLHQMSVSSENTIPIERYISHFITEVPFPSPQRPRILIQLNASERISLAQPEDSPLPLSGACFQDMLTNLGPENCMTLLLYVLTEQKILIHSLRPNVLTGVAEAVSTLVFPFHWQCPYIPLCPLSLSDVLFAPMPFIVGVDSRYFDLYDPPQDIHCIDLDTRTVTAAYDDKKNLSLKLLPKKPARILHKMLQSIHDKIPEINAQYAKQRSKGLAEDEIDKEFRLKRKHQMLELEIQEAFLRFMASILKGFRSYLLPITRAPTIGTTDSNSLFDIHGFLRSRDKSHQRFFSILMKTQMFTRFIEERSFVSDKDTCLAFFDEYSEKLENDTTDCKLLNSSDSQRSERTVFVSPPESVGLPPGVVYRYSGYLQLDPTLLAPKQMRLIVVAGVRGSPAPNSPLARRTKQEMRVSQKVARKQWEVPLLWAKCLATYCYSLWFIHLPSYVKVSHDETKILRLAYDVILKMQSMRLQSADEVCYRIIMQLCGQYSHPILAVKVLFAMKRSGIQPNAITYGYYNKAVLESEWKTSNNKGFLLWMKLRNVILGVAQFRHSLRQQKNRVAAGGSRNVNSSHIRRPSSVYSEQSLASSGADIADQISRGSTESGSLPDEQAMVSGATGAGTLEVDGTKAADDGESTGGQSDNGYCSMNPDDTQKSNSSLGSASHLASASEGPSNFSASPPNPALDEQPDEQDSGIGKEQVSLRHDVLENTRLRGRSIIRTSSSGSAGTAAQSAAGLLITTNASLVDEVFAEASTPLSTRPKRPLTWTISGASSIRSDSDTDHKMELLEKDLCITESDISMKRDSNLTQHPEAVNETDSGSDTSSCASGRTLISNTSVSRLTLGLDLKCAAALEVPTTPITPDTILRSNSFASDTKILKRLASLSGKSPEIKEKAEEKEIVVASVSIPVKTEVTDPIGGGFTRGSGGYRSFRKGGTGVLGVEPAFVPVTQNDPLGLFNLPSSTLVSKAEIGKMESSPSSPLPSPTKAAAPAQNSVDKESWYNMELFRNEPKRRSIHFGHRSVNDVRSSTERDTTSKSGNIADLRNSSKNSTAQPAATSSSSGGLSRSYSFSIKTSKYLRNAFASRNEGDGPISVAAAILGRRTGGGPGGLHRSSTVPNAVGMVKSATLPAGVGSAVTDSNSASPVANHLSSIANNLSSLKLPSFAPGTPGGAAKETLLVGIKSAANTVATRLTEIKEAISTTNFASGSSSASGSLGEGEFCSAYQPDDYMSAHPMMTSLMGGGAPMEIGGYLSGISTPRRGSCDRQAGLSDDLSSEDSYGATTDGPRPSGLSALSVVKKVGNIHRAASNTSVPDSQFSEGAGPYTFQKSRNQRNVKSTALEIVMCTASRCYQPNCLSLLYDEEIMANWSAEESNLNTKCSFCNNNLVPLLTVNVKDYRTAAKIAESLDVPNPTNLLSAVPSTESIHSGNSRKSSTADRPENETDKDEVDHSQPSIIRRSCASKLVTEDPLRSRYCSLPNSATASLNDVHKTGSKDSEGEDGVKVEPFVLEPITVPYLSPLVLRKELENVLDNEGDLCLTRTEFVDEHPIIYWNLLLFFKRVELPSHLPGLALEAKTINQEREIPKSWAIADERNVNVVCLWDSVHLHEELGQPMYISWPNNNVHASIVQPLAMDQKPFSKSVIEEVFRGLLGNDLASVLRLLSNERKFSIDKPAHGHHSLYRELLFLAVRVYGRDSVDFTAFDLEYRRSFQCLESALESFDIPPSLGAVLCRRAFGDLLLPASPYSA